MKLKFPIEDYQFGDRHIDPTRIITEFEQDSWLQDEIKDLITSDLTTKEGEILVGINNPNLDKEMRKLNGLCAVAHYRWKKWQQQLSNLLNKKFTVISWLQAGMTKEEREKEIDNINAQKTENQMNNALRLEKIAEYQDKLARLKKVLVALETGSGMKFYKMKSSGATTTEIQKPYGPIKGGVVKSLDEKVQEIRISPIEDQPKQEEKVLTKCQRRKLRRQEANKQRNIRVGVQVRGWRI